MRSQTTGELICFYIYNFITLFLFYSDLLLLFISKHDFEAEEFKKAEQNEEKKQTDNENKENQSEESCEESDLFDIDESCSDIWYLYIFFEELFLFFSFFNKIIPFF